MFVFVGPSLLSFLLWLYVWWFHVVLSLCFVCEVVVGGGFGLLGCFDYVWCGVRLWSCWVFLCGLVYLVFECVLH